MSAARAAARNKPVIVVKAGRAPQGAKAAASHTGALAGSDLVFDAAVRRAGMLRVDRLEDLFDAAETLARAKPLRGERLAILTNGGGAGVLAADEMALHGGTLAELSQATLTRLDALPAGDLVARQSGGHHRRRAGDTLCRGPAGPAGRAASRCGAAHAGADGRGAECRHRAGLHPADRRRRRSPCSPAGSAARPSNRRDALAHKLACPPTTARSVPSQPSCSWWTTAATRTA